MLKKNIINLLGIQEKLVKNIERGQNFINIYVETKPKEHICPCCKSITKYVHDYRIQKIQHISIAHVTSYIILKNADTFVIIVLNAFMSIMTSFKRILENLIFYLVMLLKI